MAYGSPKKSPKKHGHLQLFFSLPYRRLYLSTAETRWCFYWASPSFPLGIPIFSTGRPHLFHWPSPSFPLAALICSEQRWAYGRPKKHGHLQHFFSLPYRRLYLSTAETRWCFSIEHPHLFHWASPSFPLSIPIFSTGRPHRLHWPPSSARSSDGPTGVRKNMAICSIFSRCLIVASISRQRKQDGAFPLSIPIFSTGHPHLFH